MRGRSGLCRMQARKGAAAGGPGPARQIGAAAANEVARAHEVSILMAAAGIAVGLCRGDSPALNTSMMRMVEPQHGHGSTGRAGSEAASSGSRGGVDLPPVTREQM